MGIVYESQRRNETHNGGIKKEEEGIQPHNTVQQCTTNNQIRSIKMAISKDSSGYGEKDLVPSKETELREGNKLIEQ